MIRVLPDYYKEFKCIGSMCTHNCCIGWGIDIDEDCCMEYLRTDGDIGRKLHEKIYKDEDGCFTFKMNGDRCPFLNSQNLCDIYTELGEDMLCTVCTEYPRYAEQFAQIEEKGIGLSCEEAGRIIFAHKEPIRFITEEFVGQELPLDDEERSLYDMLISSRAVIFDILQNRRYSLNSRVCAMLDYAQQLQNHINNGNMSSSDISLQIHETTHGGNMQNTAQITAIFKDILTRTDEWRERLNQIQEKLYSDNGRYNKMYEQIISITDERDYEKILVYFIHRYYIKAMYDYDAYAKARLAAAAYIMLRESDMLTILQNGKFTAADRIENARLFSAELEHSQDNIDALFDELLFNDAFSGEKLKLSL